MTIPTRYQGTTWANRTVGILGGSFNPAHAGHRHISLHAIKALGLDAVWWMVSPQNPLKSKKDMAPLAARMASAEAASQHPQIIITDIETSLGTRYTADTLKALQQLYPRTKFVWLMGTDNMHQMRRWKKWREIFMEVPVCILARPPRGSNVQSNAVVERFGKYQVPQDKAKSLTQQSLPAWTLLHIPLCHLSATAIRQKQKESR